MRESLLDAREEKENSSHKIDIQGTREDKLFVIADCGDPSTLGKTLLGLSRHIESLGDDTVPHVIINGDFVYPGVCTENPRNVIHNTKELNKYLGPYIDLKNLVKKKGGGITFSLGNHEWGMASRFEFCCNKTYHPAQDNHGALCNARAITTELEDRNLITESTRVQARPGTEGRTSFDYRYSAGDHDIFIADSTAITDEGQQQRLINYLQRCEGEGRHPIIVSHHPIATQSGKTLDSTEKKYIPLYEATGYEKYNKKNHNQITQQIIKACISAADYTGEITILAGHVHKAVTIVSADGQITCHVNGTGAIGESKMPFASVISCMINGREAPAIDHFQYVRRRSRIAIAGIGLATTLAFAGYSLYTIASDPGRAFDYRNHAEDFAITASGLGAGFISLCTTAVLLLKPCASTTAPTTITPKEEPQQEHQKTAASENPEGYQLLDSGSSDEGKKWTPRSS